MNFGPPGQTSASDLPEGIWGVICHVRGGEVEADVPSHFTLSAATEVAVSYVRWIAGELLRLPHRYGYNPASRYTVLVQTWDRALSSIPSLAFGKAVEGHEKVRLIPDAYYIGTGGYAKIYQYGLRTPTWSRRSGNVAWRGSVTGQGPVASPTDLPRVGLALACRARPGTDVALIGVHETMRDLKPMLEGYLQRESLLGARWPIQNFAYYKFVFDIDGHANAWGLLEKLILGCCVLKVDSPFQQWFYPQLRAWEHYIPIAADLSNLAEALQWCRENDDHCKWIAANGARLAATLRLQAELPRSCHEFMNVAQASWL